MDHRHRVSLMFIGILVCVPILALYQFGFFPGLAHWLGGALLRLLVLPPDGVKSCLWLQYGCYTAYAFLSAWVGLEMKALWKKFAFLLGLSYLTGSLTVTLAWAGILFEPFSGLLAAWSACLVALMVKDIQPEEAKPTSNLTAELPEKKKGE